MNRATAKKSLIFGGVVCLCCSIATAGLRDVRTFFNGFVKNPATVGAIFPCTARVGEELVKYMRVQQRREPSLPLRILEVGAGTGSITEVIVKYLRPIDHLDLVEISEEYCQELSKKFGDRDNVSIHCASILKFVPAYQYDIIISTLPFMSLDPCFISDVLNHFRRLSAPGGFLSFVGYAGIPVLKKSVLWGRRKREHCDKLDLLHNFCGQYQIDAKTILGNVPPINIYHLCIAK